MTDNSDENTLPDLQVKWMKQTDLARYLGITARSLREYCDDGRIPPEGKNSAGRMNPAVVLPAMFAHLREIAAGRSVGHQDPDKEILDPIYEKAALSKSQRLKTEADRKLKEIQVAQAEGRVIDRMAITAVMSSIVTAAKAKLVAFPNVLSTRIHGLSRSDIQTIGEAVHEVLTALETDLPRAVDETVEKVVSNA